MGRMLIAGLLARQRNHDRDGQEAYRICHLAWYPTGVSWRWVCACLQSARSAENSTWIEWLFTVQSIWR